ncbi:MAG TPA: autotransporter-associated beta strand repeat-containing protein, partial [Tepidisphaeraceae bacterium]|nr:autotransporter-associated beta strand repeat-containing protein [Tepidisphaeraceae bacterium]
LFYEPVGLSGETTQAVQVLQWDEPAFFTAGLTWNNMGAAGDGATWDNVTNVNWNNGSGAVNFMAADNVTFNDANNGHYAVTLNSAVSPGAVTFDNSAGNYTVGGTGGIAGAGTLTKLGSGTLTISTVNTYSGDTIVSAGTLTLAAAGSIASGKVTAASGATLNVLGSLASTAAITSSGTVNFAGNSSTTTSGARTIGALTINAGTVTIQSSMLPGKPMVLTTASLSGAGTLDLTNNELITTAAAAAIRGRIIAHQIISSVGAVGYLDLGNGKIEARYTLIGDADLNGAVDVGDLGALATNYGITTGGSWSGGDFNYDNMVDVGDLGALATNYGNALAGNAAATVTAVVSTSVPEPPVVALGVLARLCCLSLRRKRS